MSASEWVVPSMILGILGVTVTLGTLILRFVVKAEKAMTETATQTKISNGHLAEVSSRVTTLEREAIQNATAEATKANTTTLQKILLAIEELKGILRSSTAAK